MSTTFPSFIRGFFAGDRIELHPTRVLAFVRLVWQVRRERNQLALLTRQQLLAMGIHPRDAEREASRSLFDLPKSRLGQIR